MGFRDQVLNRDPGTLFPSVPCSTAAQFQEYLKSLGSSFRPCLTSEHALTNPSLNSKTSFPCTPETLSPKVPDPGASTIRRFPVRQRPSENVVAITFFLKPDCQEIANTCII